MSFQADYQVVLFDTDGNQLDLLTMQRIQKLEYTRILNDFGNVSLTIDAEDDAAQYKADLDTIIEVYRRNEAAGNFEVEGTYLLRFWNQFEDEAGKEYVIMAGVGLEQLLSRRVIVPEDDPLNAGGFSTKAGVSDVVMREFVVEQCISPAVNTIRAIDGLTAAAVNAIGYLTFQRRSYDELLQVIKELATKGNVDFRIIRTTGAAFEFQAQVIGQDRTRTANYPTNQYVLFDPRRGNMSVPSLTVDRKEEKTFVYILGQGVEDERTVFPLPSTSQTDSKWNRIEVTTDARNTDDTDGLIAAGAEILNEKRPQTEMTFQPVLDTSQARYNVDWTLGDRVTAQYSNYEQDLRVVKINVSVDEYESIDIELQNEP